MKSAQDSHELAGKRKFSLGERVTKIKGSSWTGHVVGFYETGLTPIGYAIESEKEPGSVQIYPENALAASPPASSSGTLEAVKRTIDYRLNEHLCEMKPEYDDSIHGFNEAWDIVSEAFAALAQPAEAAMGPRQQAHYEALIEENKDLKARLFALQPAEAERAVAVKALEWKWSPKLPDEWYASPYPSPYKIRRDRGEPDYYIVSGWSSGTNPYTTLEAAQAAAQADYESHIVSALTPSLPHLSHLHTRLATVERELEDAKKALTDAWHEASCCDDIPLNQTLANFIADLQAARAVAEAKLAELEARNDK